MDLYKKRYILLAIVIIFASLSFGVLYSGFLLKDNLYIAKVLQDVLTFDERTDYLSRSDITPLVYDIQSSRSTLGRAILLGDNIFLTAYHVIENKENLQIVYQKKRGKLLPNTHQLEVLAGTWDYDLALVRSKVFFPIGRSKISLRTDKYTKDTLLSQFLYYKGPKKHKDFILSYDGLDYYDSVRKVKDLGKFVFLKDSPLFEKQGKINFFDKTFFYALGMDKGKAKVHPEIQYFTSIPVFPGESGSAIFYRTTDNFDSVRYAFMGITVIAWAINYDIETKGHPLGYKSVQQSSNFIVRSSKIKEFIEKYLNGEY